MVAWRSDMGNEDDNFRILKRSRRVGWLASSLTRKSWPLLSVYIIVYGRDIIGKGNFAAIFDPRKCTTFVQVYKHSGEDIME